MFASLSDLSDKEFFLSSNNKRCYLIRVLYFLNESSATCFSHSSTRKVPVSRPQNLKRNNILPNLLRYHVLVPYILEGSKAIL